MLTSITNNEFTLFRPYLIYLIDNSLYRYKKIYLYTSNAVYINNSIIGTLKYIIR